jgi:hypothetical protein
MKQSFASEFLHKYRPVETLPENISLKPFHLGGQPLGSLAAARRNHLPAAPDDMRK